MKLLRLLFTVLTAFAFSIFFTPGPSFAQVSNPDQAVKQYNITFPIAELGNCTDFNSCKSYCDDSSHQDACTAFAKKKGFYKPTTAPTNDESQLLADAKAALGCDSKAACMAFCQNPDNQVKCTQFAQVHHLNTGSQNHSNDPQVLEKAKSILGCDSVDSCKAICQDPANQQKCSDFARQSGLGGGEQRVGPGGCSSEDSCRVYCQSHQDECANFQGSNHSEGQQGFQGGPGGCTSPDSCRAYCQSHPDQCNFKGQGGSNGQNFQGGPNQSGQGQQNQFSGPGGCNSPQSCASYCQSHPDQCQNFQGGNPQGSPGNFPPPSIPPNQSLSPFPQPSFQPSFQPSQPPFFNPPIQNPSPGSFTQNPSPTPSGAVKGISTGPSVLEQIFSLFRR